MKHENIVDLLVQKYTENNKSAKLITYLNPYSYLLVRKKLPLLSNFDLIHVDGISLVVILKLFGVITVQRNSFDMSSNALDIFNKAIEQNKSVYFIGAKEIEIDDAIENIINAFPALNISGSRNGFFKNDSERDTVLNELTVMNPDIVVCGMSTPLQEIFLSDLQQRNWQGVGYTCGGFLHQSAQRLDYYSSFINRYHLRWLYRIYKEPKLLQRYVWEYPKFLLYFIKDFITWKYRN